MDNIAVVKDYSLIPFIYQTSMMRSRLTEVPITLIASVLHPGSLHKIAAELYRV